MDSSCVALSRSDGKHRKKSTEKILQRVPQHLHYLDNQNIIIMTVVLKRLL